MTHYRWDEMEREEMNPLLSRKVIHSDRMTVANFDMRKGAQVPLHSHDNEQISTVWKGRVCFHIGGKDQIVEAGEAVAIPSNVVHGADALEDSVCLEVFVPGREDWKQAAKK